MPTIPVDKADLFERLGKQYSASFLFTFLQISEVELIWNCGLLIVSCHVATEEFDRLCFDYGLELDEDVSLGCGFSDASIKD